jgi:hypothetical protein
MTKDLTKTKAKADDGSLQTNTQTETGRATAIFLCQKTVTEIVTDVLTWVPKLTLLTLSGYVESTTYVLSTTGECIRLTGLPAIF